MATPINRHERRAQEKREQREAAKQPTMQEWMSKPGVRAEWIQALAEDRKVHEDNFGQVVARIKIIELTLIRRGVFTKEDLQATIEELRTLALNARPVVVQPGTAELGVVGQGPA